MSDSNKLAEAKRATMDLDSAYLTLRVTAWVQTISNNDPLGAPGATMCASCSAINDHSLTLSTGERITEIPINVTLAQGPLTRGNGQPLERGIGLFNYIRSEGIRPPICDRLLVRT